jgi:hypothetical protein
LNQGALRKLDEKITTDMRRALPYLVRMSLFTAYAYTFLLFVAAMPLLEVSAWLSRDLTGSKHKDLCDLVAVALACLIAWGAVNSFPTEGSYPTGLSEEAISAGKCRFSSGKDDPSCP